MNIIGSTMGIYFKCCPVQWTADITSANPTSILKLDLLLNLNNSKRECTPTTQRIVFTRCPYDKVTCHAETNPWLLANHTNFKNNFAHLLTSH